MESRAKETAKKTAKKGKNGIVKLIFSRIFIFALLIFLQLLVLFYFFWHVNEQFKIFYDFIRIITVFLVLYIVNEKKSESNHENDMVNCNSYNSNFWRTFIFVCKISTYICAVKKKIRSN